mmetsp:Transcript_9326/g.13801  ORF Transcript_9326/g.13801 Transcript_9326/m.13801 type:complete len:101 (+) Transcript_9326:126-428(+)
MQRKENTNLVGDSRRPLKATVCQLRLCFEERFACLTVLEMIVEGEKIPQERLQVQCGEPRNVREFFTSNTSYLLGAPFAFAFAMPGGGLGRAFAPAQCGI